MAGETARDLPLAPETPVELMANGAKVAVLMCTPLNLDDLAAGHLFARGMLSDPERVLAIGACADLRVMSVVAPGAIIEDRYGLGQVIASGCGSGAALSERSGLERLPLGYSVSLARLKDWSAAMFKAAELYRATGGMHCAALALEEGAPAPRVLGAARSPESLPEARTYFVVREDVGRHNAVDKVLGKAFMDRVDFPSACLLTSGRIAADMILKAAAARVPVLVSRSIPTTTAYEIAQEAGISLVGRIGDRQPIVYTYPERIRLA
jgi:FdhD protein